jgi:hypothetical protein
MTKKRMRKLVMVVMADAVGKDDDDLVGMAWGTT